MYIVIHIVYNNRSIIYPFSKRKGQVLYDISVDLFSDENAVIINLKRFINFDKIEFPYIIKKSETHHIKIYKVDVEDLLDRYYAIVFVEKHSPIIDRLLLNIEIHETFEEAKETYRDLIGEAEKYDIQIIDTDVLPVEYSTRGGARMLRLEVCDVNEPNGKKDPVRTSLYELIAKYKFDLLPLVHIEDPIGANDWYKIMKDFVSLDEIVEYTKKNNLHDQLRLIYYVTKNPMWLLYPDEERKRDTDAEQ